MTNDLERRPTRLPTRERIMRRVLGAVVTLGTGTLILTLAIDQPISVDISGRVEGRAKVIIGTPGAVEREIRELPPVAVARYVAFPGAEGYGAQATWGLRWRTQKVARAGFLPIVAAIAVPNDSACDRSNAYIHHVTNLSTSGSGSLADIMQNDLHDDTLDIVVFDTAGDVTFTGVVRTNHNCVYIAGQSAQGGIQIKGSNGVFRINHDHSIVRYMRFRMGESPSSVGDNMRIWGSGAANKEGVIADHLSIAFWNDEALNLNVYDRGVSDTLENVTIQHTLFCCAFSKHPTAFLVRGGVRLVSSHKNLYVNFGRRSPKCGGAPEMCEVVNNVIYGWDFRNVNLSDASLTEADIINNYYKVGPVTDGDAADRILEIRDTNDSSTVYIEGNKLVSISDAVVKQPSDNDWDYVEDNNNNPVTTDYRSLTRLMPVAAIPIDTVSADSAYALIITNQDAGAYQYLDCDGSWVAFRDSVDVLAYRDFANGTINDTGNSSYGTDESDYGGGIPTMSVAASCADADNDGLPDTYETAQCGTTTCMDPRADGDGDGFINLEEYLNGTNP